MIVRVMWSRVGARVLTCRLPWSSVCARQRRGDLQDDAKKHSVRKTLKQMRPLGAPPSLWPAQASEARRDVRSHRPITERIAKAEYRWPIAVALMTRAILAGLISACVKTSRFRMGSGVDPRDSTSSSGAWSGGMPVLTSFWPSMDIKGRATKHSFRFIPS